jgi:hypothetical protein
MRNVYNILDGEREGEGDYLEGNGIGWRIILKWILRKHG